MAVETIARPGIVFAVWSGHPTIADVDTIERLLADTARSSPGSKVVYVARIPATSAAPDSAVMRHMINRLGGFKQHCSAYHGIIEGKGFGVAMKRGIITTFLQLSQTRSRVFVHARVSSLLKAASEQGLTQLHSVLEEAQRRGLLGEKPLESLAAH